MAIDAVVKAWARVADAANCAILLVHHTRKENGAKITADPPIIFRCPNAKT